MIAQDIRAASDPGLRNPMGGNALSGVALRYAVLVLLRPGNIFF